MEQIESSSSLKELPPDDVQSKQSDKIPNQGQNRNRRVQAKKKISFGSEKEEFASISQILQEQEQQEEAGNLSCGRYSFYRSPKSPMSQNSDPLKLKASNIKFADPQPLEEEEKKQSEPKPNKPLKSLNKDLALTVTDIEAAGKFEEAKQQYKKTRFEFHLKKSSSLNNIDACKQNSSSESSISNEFNLLPHPNPKVNSADIQSKDYQQNLFISLAKNNDDSYLLDTPPQITEKKNDWMIGLSDSSCESKLSKESFKPTKNSTYTHKNEGGAFSHIGTLTNRSQMSQNMEFGKFQLVEQALQNSQIGLSSHKQVTCKLRQSTSKEQSLHNTEHGMGDSSGYEFQRTKERKSLLRSQNFPGLKSSQAHIPQAKSSAMSFVNCQSQHQPADIECIMENQRQIYEVSTQEMKDQKNQLIRSKLFLNMVVHDMRNPTKSIKMGLQQAISKLRDQFKTFEEQRHFERKCQKMQENLKQKQDIQINKSYRQLFQENELGITGRVHLLIEQLENNNKSNKMQNQDLKDCVQGMLGLLDATLNEIAQPYEEQPILDESFEDFDEGEMDEGMDGGVEEDQIVQQPRRSIQWELEKLQKETHESNLLKDKKRKMRSALGDLVKKFPSHRQANEQLIEDFIDRYYSVEDRLLIESHQRPIQQKPESHDFSQQVNFDFETIHKANKLDQVKEKLDQFRDMLQKTEEKITAQRETMGIQQNLARHQLQILSLQNDQLQKHQELLNRQVETQGKYYEEVFKHIDSKTKEVEKILQSQVFSQQMMENLINDLLDLAKMQNSSFQFTNEYFSLSNIIYEAFQMLLFSANEKGIELKAEIDQCKNLNLIEAIHGDENRFLQIIINFLSNSLKFTDPSGSITVKIEILSEQPIINEMELKRESQKSLNKLLKQSKNKLSTKSIISIISGTKNLQENQELTGIENTLEQELKNIRELNKSKIDSNQIGQEKWVNFQISIIDTGIGISEQGLKNLFIDFGKLDESSSRNRQGTGLGLSICKQIIESMGGSVDVTSEIGHGTQFIINIKAKCKSTRVKFNEEFQDISSFESNRSRSMFFKFIEKNKHEDILRSAIETQIQSNKEKKARKNEQEIQMMSQFANVQNKSSQQFQQRCNEQLDELISEAFKMTDRAKRVKVLSQKSGDDNELNEERNNSFYIDQISEEQIMQANASVVSQRYSSGVHQAQMPAQIGESNRQEEQKDQPQFNEEPNIFRERSALVDDSESAGQSSQEIEEEPDTSQDQPHFVSFNIGEEQKEEQNVIQIGNVSFLEEMKSPEFNNILNSNVNNSINSALSPIILNQNIIFEKKDGQNSAKLGNPNYKRELIENQLCPQKIEVGQVSSSSFSDEQHNEEQKVSEQDIKVSEQDIKVSDQDIQVSEQDIKFKCLIANDDPMQLYVLQIIFQMNNFEVTTAQNGHEAYEKVIESLRNKGQKLSENGVYAESLFDLIVLDLNMPISNGYEACKNIVNLYADNKQLFKLMKEESISNVIDQNQKSHDSLHLQNTDLKPIIVACTSDIIDDNLLQKLFKIGFENCYEVPVKDELIKNELKPILLERAQQLNRKNEIMKYIVKESVDGLSEDQSFDSHLSSVQRQMSIQNMLSHQNLAMSIKQSNKFLRVPTIQSIQQPQAKKKILSKKRANEEEEEKKFDFADEANQTPQFSANNVVTHFQNQLKQKHNKKKDNNQNFQFSSSALNSQIKQDQGSFKQISEESKQSSKRLNDSPNHQQQSNQIGSSVSDHRFPYQRQDGLINNLCQDSLLKEMEALKSVSSKISSDDPLNRIIYKQSNHKISKKQRQTELKDIQDFVKQEMPKISPRSCPLRKEQLDQACFSDKIHVKKRPKVDMKIALQSKHQSMKSMFSQQIPFHPNLPKLQIQIDQHDLAQSSGSSFRNGIHSDPKLTELDKIQEESKQVNLSLVQENKKNHHLMSSKSSDNKNL